MTSAPESVPSVSIVLPTYRRPEFLARAVASVREQSVDDWELLIVDDNPPASDDRRETERLVARWTDDARVRYLTHPENRGGSAARNTGIAHARAPYVAFLDDDDEWLPPKLERQLARFCDESDDVAMVYCGHRRRYGGSRPDRVVIPEPEVATLERLLERNRIGTTSSVMCRREALAEVGGFDAALPASQDYDLYVRLARRYRIAGVLEALVVSHRHGDGQITKTPPARREAFLRFYDKHRDLLAEHPEAHARHLHWIGERLLRLGFVADARAKLDAAIALEPLALRARALRALCAIGEPNRQRLWSARSAARTLLARLRGR